MDRARQVYYNARGVTLPVLITELNMNHEWERGTDPRLQQVIATVWTSLVIRTSVLKGIEHILYATFGSWKSEAELSSTGGYGFGMVNLDDNQPWYPYYLLKMIGTSLNVGDQLIQVTSSSDDLRTLAWKHDGKVSLLLIFKSKSLKTVSVTGLLGQIYLQKIDETIPYTNPSIQTDQINAQDVMTFNGYTIVLLSES